VMEIAETIGTLNVMKCAEKAVHSVLPLLMHAHSHTHTHTRTHTHTHTRTQATTHIPPFTHQTEVAFMTRVGQNCTNTPL